MKKFILFIFAIAAFSAQAHVAELIPTAEQDIQFMEFVKALDPNSPACSLSYKDSGTSVGMKLKLNGEKAGKWVPRNSATDPEAQVVSYHLARFLGMGNLVVPSAYFVVNGSALQKFKAMLQAASERNKWRLKNRNDTLAAIAKSPGGLSGVFTAHMESGSYEARGVANPAANTINFTHPIAKFIRASGAKPSPGRRMSLDGVRKPNQPAPQAIELELAMQFSRIMVLDMLMGQWDRWSGGNVEAGIDGDRVFFVARDNGGASLRGTSHMNKYRGIVTRFDRAQIERVQLLVDVLSDPARSVEFAQALGIRTAKHSLLERAKGILEHVKSQSKQYGENAYF